MYNVVKVYVKTKVTNFFLERVQFTDCFVLESDELQVFKQQLKFEYSIDKTLY